MDLALLNGHCQTAERDDLPASPPPLTGIENASKIASFYCRRHPQEYTLYEEDRRRRPRVALTSDAIEVPGPPGVRSTAGTR